MPIFRGDEGMAGRRGIEPNGEVRSPPARFSLMAGREPRAAKRSASIYLEGDRIADRSNAALAFTPAVFIGSPADTFRASSPAATTARQCACCRFGFTRQAILGRRPNKHAADAFPPCIKTPPENQ